MQFHNVKKVSYFHSVCLNTLISRHIVLTVHLKSERCFITVWLGPGKMVSSCKEKLDEQVESDIRGLVGPCD